MTLQEVISLLKKNELKQLKLKDDTDLVISFINLGLIELYKHFYIETKEYVITLQALKQEYEMPDDYMWLVGAYTEKDLGNGLTKPVELKINADNDSWSVYTTAYNKVMIPVPIAGARVSLIYVKSPIKFTAAKTDLVKVLPIPDSMIEPLVNYVAYKAHSSMTNSSDSDDSMYLQRYENSIAKLNRFGMYNDSDLDMDKRITEKGFV